MGSSNQDRRSVLSPTSTNKFMKFKFTQTTWTGEGCLTAVYMSGTLYTTKTGTLAQANAQTSSSAPQNGTWNSGSPQTGLQYRYSTGASSWTSYSFTEF